MLRSKLVATPYSQGFVEPTITAATTQYAGNWTVTAPSGRSSGDLLVGIATCAQDYLDPSAKVSGWTHRSSTTYGTPDGAVSIFTRVADGTSGDNFTASGISTLNWTAGIHWIVLMPGGSYSDITTGTGATGMPNAPANSMVDGVDVSLIVGHLDTDNVTMTAPSGWTLLATQYYNYGTPGHTVGVAWALATSSSMDPAAFGGGGDDQWIAKNIHIAY